MTTRTVFISGANRGLGLQTARVLAGQGHRVLIGSRSLEKGQAAAAQLENEGGVARAFALDLEDPESIAACLDALRAEGEHVDVLVNNAGVVLDNGGTFDVGSDTVERTFRINVAGAYSLIQALLQPMNEAGYGRVVNVSSGMGGLAEMSGGWPAYRISKAALNATTRIFSAATRGDVKVNSVCPGWVRTEMGGAGADRSVEDGAAGIIWAATLPSDGPSGGFFRDGKPITW